MKVYRASTQISYFTQSHFNGRLGDIFNHSLQAMGSSLLTQIYEDLPQCFTQKNMNDRQMTEYKVEVVVMSTAEYERMARELQFLRNRAGTPQTIGV